MQSVSLWVWHACVRRYFCIDLLAMTISLCCFPVTSVVYCEYAQCHGGAVFLRHRHNLLHLRETVSSTAKLRQQFLSLGLLIIPDKAHWLAQKRAIISGNYHNYYNRKRSSSSCLRLWDSFIFKIFFPEVATIQVCLHSFWSLLISTYYWKRARRVNPRETNASCRWPL